MYTFINLQRIIDTLPLYEKKKLKIEGAEYVNVCLEDIYNSMSDFEKQEFLENNGEQLARDCGHLISLTNTYCGMQEDFNNESDWDKLSSIDDDTIVSYLQDQGYNITDY